MPNAELDLAPTLREVFGHEQFRPGQERLIRALLAGRDAVGILPTGAGKSLAYQLTSQLLPGVTLVVSPLVALMHDQAESLQARGVEVAVVTSLQTKAETELALSNVRTLAARLLYVTPERLENDEFRAELNHLRVSLFVVDEAHSISEWGQSFRPAYLNLSAAIELVGRPPVLALTATATPWVRSDIVNHLGLRDPDIVVHGTGRPNLFLEVLRVEDEAEDHRVLDDLFHGRDASGESNLAAPLADALRGSGIIYAATTRAARETVEWLRQWGISSDYYHGQRKKADRERVQAGFMSGEIRVVAATNAFGMGIDKPDIRFVIHRDIPPSVERYYQEIGRAGRDGDFARCTLIYRPGDLGRAAFLAGGGELTRDEVVRAHAAFSTCKNSPATIRELQQASSLGRTDVMRLVQLLEDAGIARHRQRRIQLLADFDPEALPLERENARRAYERSRLEMVRNYAELRECRWRFILNYFGEEPTWSTCEHCDVDSMRNGDAVPVDRGQQPFAVEDRVVHASLGPGVVQRVTDTSITVLFDSAGYKTLDTALVIEQDLVAHAARSA